MERYVRVLYIFATCPSAPVVGLYLLTCFSAPHLMKLFRPFDLRQPLALHSFICSAFSLYSLASFLMAFKEDNDVFSTEDKEGTLKHAIFVIWMSKWYELLDTVFMVLRHRSKQISFLHVFHHASVPILADYAYHHACWPAFLIIGSLNSFVHVVMYGYYGLTALFPLKDFSFKKRITQLQMFQFLVATLQGVWGYLHYKYCIYSFLYPLALLALFSNFYYQAYLRQKKRKIAEVEKKVD